MARRYRVALVGDYNPAVVAHQAIPKALELAAANAGTDVEGVWIHTSSIYDPQTQLRGFEGVWCVPASPYSNATGALEAIRYAREQGLPFLGTCGGFQHALLEYARNVCGLSDAEHAENSPGASLHIISPLSCSLVERSDEIILADQGLLRKAYGQSRIVEDYHCSYGLNPAYAAVLFRDGLQPSAYDLAGAVRAAELTTHPFFIGTLFQPERRALRGEIPPIVAAFLTAMISDES